MMRNVGWWIPISLLVLLGTVTALLSAAPSLGAGELRSLGDDDPAARSSAIEHLVSAGSTSDLLYELDQDHTPLVKAGLAEALRRRGVTSDDVATLEGLLGSSNVTTRYLAAGLLGPVASRAREALATRAADPDETTLVRAAAARALGGAGARARTPLRGLAYDRGIPATVRHAAIRALAVVDSGGTDDVR
ncbi:MAG: HEAT repeat domain-containing protein, partial [Planctomycetota bacterium]